MSKASQYPRPPQRRDAIAMSRAWRRRGDNADLHLKSRISYLTSQGASPESRPHISSIGLRLFGAPRIFARARRDAARVGRRFTTRRHLPFGLGRQPAFGPPAIGFGLIPVDMDHRQIGFERNPLIENAALPFVFARGTPVNGMRGASELAPAPALIATQFAAAVAGVVHEPGEFGLPDSRPRD